MTWGQKLSTQSAFENSAPEGPVIREGEDEYALKMAYAAAVFKLGANWRDAGFKVFPGPDNRGRAMQADIWRNDIDVEAELDRLREDETQSVVTPEGLARRFIAIMDSPGTSKADQIKAGLAAAEVLGHIKQPSNTNINNGTITNNVLRVPAKPTTPEEQEIYEIRLKARQLKLVSDARSSK